MTSGEVALRAVVESDVATFFEDQRDPEGRAMAVFASRGREEHEAHWHRILADETVITRTVVMAGEVAGNVFSWVQGTERLVGYWIGRRFWGRGIATEALRLFVSEYETVPLRICR